MENKQLELDSKETSLIALAVRMQIETLEEGIEAITYAPGTHKEQLMNMRSMLTSYRKLYKRFGSHADLVDEFMRNTDN